MDRTSAAQIGDARRVPSRHVVEQDLGVAGRRHTSEVDVVFDANRDAVQRPRSAACHDVAFGASGRCRRVLRVDADEGSTISVAGLDLGNDCLICLEDPDNWSH